MTRRNLLLFFAASLAWVAFLGITRPWQGDAHARTRARVGLLYPQLRQEFDQISRVVITAGEQSTTLQLGTRREHRVGSGWMVKEKNFPVDYERLTQMLDNLASIKTSDVVSVRSDKHAIYGVVLGQGTRVQVFTMDNRLLVDWIAGSLRHQDIAGGQKPVLEFYMRDARSDRVYLSGDALLPAVDAVRWCEVHLLKGIALERIAWIERKDFQNGESWRVERRTTAQADGEGISSPWFMTAPRAIPALAFAGDSMAASIVGLSVADVVAAANPQGGDEARYGFPQDRFRVGIEGQEFLFELGKPAAQGQRYLRVKDLPYIFTLANFDVNQLRQPVERMLRVGPEE